MSVPQCRVSSMSLAFAIEAHKSVLRVTYFPLRIPDKACKVLVRHQGSNQKESISTGIINHPFYEALLVKFVSSALSM